MRFLDASCFVDDALEDTAHGGRFEGWGREAHESLHDAPLALGIADRKAAPPLQIADRENQPDSLREELQYPSIDVVDRAPQCVELGDRHVVNRTSKRAPGASGEWSRTPGPAISAYRCRVDRARPMDWFSTALAVLACALLIFRIPASAALHGSPGVQSPEGLVPDGSRVGRFSLVARTEQGAPVSGARVRILWGPDERYAMVGEGLTDAGGQLVLDGLPRGSAWILVEAGGLARRALAADLAPGQVVEVTLERARSLRVRVQAEDGTALPGATVLVTGVDPLPFGALTGIDGIATFDRLGKGPFRIRAAARGLEPETRSDVLADTTIVLRRAGTLEAHVTDEAGKPVSGATVLVAGPSLWPARSLVTGADGVARLPGLSEGAYDLKAMRDMLVSTTEVGVHVERGQVLPVALVLRPGRMIPFIVTDGEGDHPLVVAGADVVVVEGGVSSFPIQGRTSTFGKVVLGPVARGMVMASAGADGFVSRSTVDVPDVISSEVRIPLLRGAVLEGSVVDGDGQPVEGATVEIVGTDVDGAPLSLTPVTAAFQRAHFAWALEGPQPLLPGGELGIMPGPIPAIPGEGDTQGLRMPMAPMESPSEPWVTRLDGTFRATPVPPGRVAALVRHPSYVEATSEMVILAPGATGHVRVVLLPGGTLDGTVVDEHDLPVAGVRVEIAAVRGSLTRGGFTSDDGAFSFSALPSEVTVTLSRPDDPSRPVLRRRIVVPDRGHVEEKLVLPAPLPPVEVSAEDESGRPVAVAQVTALSLDPERPLRETEFTDAAGRVTIPDAAGLSLKIVVEAQDYAVWDRTFDRAPERVRADLVPSVLVEGRVTAVRGRQDVTGATVELLADGHRQTAFTDAAGRYHFAGVSPGPAHVTVSHPELATRDVDIRILATGRADRSFDVEPIDLEEPGIIEGRVVDAEGRPVRGARVGIGKVSSYLPAMTAGSGTTTNGDGVFRLERVGSGSVQIEAFLTGSGRGRAVVSLAAGATVSDVTIELGESPDDLEGAATGDVAVTLDERRSSGRAGIVITAVARASEAEHAGLLTGDVVETIDRVRPVGATDARRRLAGPDGSDVILELIRAGEPVSARVRRERVRR